MGLDEGGGEEEALGRWGGRGSRRVRSPPLIWQETQQQPSKMCEFERESKIARERERRRDRESISFVILYLRTRYACTTVVNGKP